MPRKTESTPRSAKRLNKLRRIIRILTSFMYTTLRLFFGGCFQHAHHRRDSGTGTDKNNRFFGRRQLEIPGGCADVKFISLLNFIVEMRRNLKTAAEKQPERAVTFIHAAKNGEYAAFRKEAEQAAENIPEPALIRTTGFSAEDSLKSPAGALTSSLSPS
jgi:hypothetical protein